MTILKVCITKTLARRIKVTEVDYTRSFKCSSVEKIESFLDNYYGVGNYFRMMFVKHKCYGWFMDEECDIDIAFLNYESNTGLCYYPKELGGNIEQSRQI